MAWRPWYEELADMNSARDREKYVRDVFGPPAPSLGNVASSLVTAGLVAHGIRGLIAGLRGRRRSESHQVGFSREDAARAEAWLIDFKSWAKSKEAYFQAIAGGIRKNPDNVLLHMSMLEAKASEFRRHCNEVYMHASDGRFDLVDVAFERANSALYEIELRFGPPSDFSIDENPGQSTAKSEVDVSDELWESVYAELSEVEPEMRLALLEIRAKLTARNESGTARTKELDSLETDLNSLFKHLRRCLLTKDSSKVRAIIVEDVQPRMNRIRELFADLEES